MIAVKASDTGIEYKTPSRAKNLGKTNAKATPNTMSRTIESSVDSIAFPIACIKIKVALLIHAKIIMQRYIRKAFIAKSV